MSSDLPHEPSTPPAEPLPDFASAPGTQQSFTVTAAVTHEHLALKKLRFEVIAGPDQGLVTGSTAERTVIGTHESADIVLEDPTVSRFHCEISTAGDRVLVRDLGSRNGTEVDGVFVIEAYLRPGSVLGVGRTRVRADLGLDRLRLPISKEQAFGTLAGTSAPMRRIFALLERAAASDATVLIEGETGTGKEVTAESIHMRSLRADGPFIVVDCGAIPEDLIESELFGHEKGSFTGAVAAREGAFQAAHGGTLFLDEIGELGLELQPKLLRALEKREIKKVGSTRYTNVDVRVIAATNRDLKTEVNAGRFRSDLYYRLAVVRVTLPPLRERVEDIPLLVGKILDSLGVLDSSPELEFLRSEAFVAQVSRHGWPGNVRELRNYLERCVALRVQTPLEPTGTPVHVAPNVDVTQPLKAERERWVATFERQYLQQLLERHAGNVTAAARAASVDRPHFYRLLWKHGLK